MKCEILEYNELGYQTLMKYNNWRVAILNFIDDCHIDKLQYLEAHNETDEAFILLEGEATLIFGDIYEHKLSNISSIKLERNKVYNIKKHVYHTQVLSDDAKLLIVEEADTGDNNSDKYYLNEEDLERIKGAI